MAGRNSAQLPATLRVRTRVPSGELGSLARAVLGLLSTGGGRTFTKVQGLPSLGQDTGPRSATGALGGGLTPHSPALVPNTLQGDRPWPSACLWLTV